jgi:hypothetical protein
MNSRRRMSCPRAALIFSLEQCCRETAFGRSFCLAVPELTRSADIKLNERVVLLMQCKILSSSKSRRIGRCCPTPAMRTARSGVAAEQAAAPPIVLPETRASMCGDWQRAFRRLKIKLRIETTHLRAAFLFQIANAEFITVKDVRTDTGSC